MNIRSVSVSRELAGSTPPSVFVGSWNYPKVFAGPMIAPQEGDTGIMDSPEEWIPARKTIQNIVDYRMSLVRGKHQIGITDLDNRFVEKLQEVALSDKSVSSEAEFKSQPRGVGLSDEHTPYGPSGILEKFDIGNCRWDNQLEKVYHDTDFMAKDAVLHLYDEGVPFSRIQKAFSVGTVGRRKNRKLVPTRWSITACDSMLADDLLEDVRHNPVIDHYEVREFASLRNYYAILLVPTAWQYEWMEAFLHVMGSEEVLFCDHETNRGKKEYSSVGGCYYSCKFGVLEALGRERVQAGAIVFREAYEGYVPLGVFNVRENVRTAAAQQPKKFDTLRSSLSYISGKIRLPLSRFVNDSTLLKELLEGKQTRLFS